MSGSEVARLRRHLDQICIAMHRSLHDYAVVGRHAVITHKYRQLGETQEKLAAYVGSDQAFEEVLAALHRSEQATRTGQASPE